MLLFRIRASVCVATVILALLLAVLAMLNICFEGRRTSMAEPLAAFSREEVQRYEKLVREDEARIVPGLGDNGDAVHLTGQGHKLGEESEKKLAMNVYLSDRISYNRTLRDYRNPACSRVTYDAVLPSVSVIIIFHNEPYSVVVRTIWSVLNSALRSNPWFRQTKGGGNVGYPGQDPHSTYVYLKEIILVDDNSTLPELKGKLDYYIDTRLPKSMIRVLRLDERIGLTRARLYGAKFATGDAIVFLDAHCEVDNDWLRPLLQRVADSPSAVVMPIIDVIDKSTFYYSTQDPEFFQVGGFNFAGHFTWIDVPSWEKKRRGSEVSPTWSPTMAGGLFAINRNYYWEIGAYDEQMNGWGGENLEMSFRVWQCGGTLETIPCSRVGHVFRSFHPYGLPGNSDTHGINTARMAEVWMDEYAELYYLNRPDLRSNPVIGDVTHRKVLREKLKCKSFQWYLDNVYRDKFIPVKDVYGYGRISNPMTGLCLDNMQKEENLASLGVYACHTSLLATQYFAISHAGQLRTEEKCMEVRYTRDDKSTDDSTAKRVLMTNCHGKKREQYWQLLPSGQILNVQSKLCLDASGLESGSEILARRCDRDRATQRWEMEYSEADNFGVKEGEDMTEQQRNLEIIRKGGGKRRIARSLLSSHSNYTRRNNHKNNKKGKTKNKFILKISRLLPNASEEHLEMDIYCKHRQLFPNNTFVREIVTILNKNDIKVINNGRVFENNHITKVKVKKHKKKDKKWEPVNNETNDPSYSRHYYNGAIVSDSEDNSVVNQKHNKNLDEKKHIDEGYKSDKNSEIDDKKHVDSGYKSDKNPEMGDQKHRDDGYKTESDVKKAEPKVQKAKKLKKKRKHKKVHDKDKEMLRNRKESKTVSKPDTESDVERKTNVEKPKDGHKIKRKKQKGKDKVTRFEHKNFDIKPKDHETADKQSDVSAEKWPVGESRFRTVQSDKYRRNFESSTSKSDKKTVKFILKSNLTFNFGNDFFENYRRQGVVDKLKSLVSAIKLEPNTTVEPKQDTEHDHKNTMDFKMTRHKEAGEDKMTWNKVPKEDKVTREKVLDEDKITQNKVPEDDKMTWNKVTEEDRVTREKVLDEDKIIHNKVPEENKMTQNKVPEDEKITWNKVTENNKVQEHNKLDDLDEGYNSDKMTDDSLGQTDLGYTDKPRRNLELQTSKPTTKPEASAASLEEQSYKSNEVNNKLNDVSKSSNEVIKKLVDVTEKSVSSIQTSKHQQKAKTSYEEQSDKSVEVNNKLREFMNKLNDATEKPTDISKKLNDVNNKLNDFSDKLNDANSKSYDSNNKSNDISDKSTEELSTSNRSSEESGHMRIDDGTESGKKESASNSESRGN